MIYVRVGKPRNGKGIMAMCAMEDAWRAGRPIFTNIELTPACPFYGEAAYFDGEEYPLVAGEPGTPGFRAFWHYLVPGAYCEIDEAHLQFDAKDHLGMADEMLHFLTHASKKGIDVCFIVQSLANLYVRIRRMAQSVTVCEWNWRTSRSWQLLGRLFGEERVKPWTTFYRTEFASEDIKPATQCGRAGISYKEASRYFGWYKTEQMYQADWLGKGTRASVKRKAVGDDVPGRSGPPAGLVGFDR